MEPEDQNNDQSGSTLSEEELEALEKKSRELLQELNKVGEQITTDAKQSEEAFSGIQKEVDELSAQANGHLDALDRANEEAGAELEELNHEMEEVSGDDDSEEDDGDEEPK